MGMKSEGDTITCDCGFSFQRGQSGKHECADGLRAKLAAAVRREESLKASVDVMGRRIAELEQPEATQQGMQILTEAIGAHGYIVGCLERNRPDLALEEALKWVAVFAQAAEQVEDE